MAADRFSLHGGSELAGIGFIVDSEIGLGPAAISCHGCCIVAGWLLVTHYALENVLHNRQLVPVVRSGDPNYRAYNEMGSRLAVLEDMPWHSGHRHLPKKMPARSGGNGRAEVRRQVGERPSDCYAS